MFSAFTFICKIFVSCISSSDIFMNLIMSLDINYWFLIFVLCINIWFIDNLFELFVFAKEIFKILFCECTTSTFLNLLYPTINLHTTWNSVWCRTWAFALLRILNHRSLGITFWVDCILIRSCFIKEIPAI